MNTLGIILGTLFAVVAVGSLALIAVFFTARAAFKDDKYIQPF